MATPLQIGITGGIGSGKSLVCKIFQSLGIPVYDADSRAKVLMTTDGILISGIKKEFGNLSYHTDGTLNRKHISEAAFGHPEKLRALDALVHPRVAENYSQWVGEQSSRYVIKEAALLFEAGSYRTLDKIIVVSAPEHLRVKRVMARDPHRSEQTIREIIRSQMSDSEKVSKADFIVTNDESELVIPQVLKLHSVFLTQP
ncbi:MAG TPA: dephospho-CoA kinase [Cyclobacteriaceae bacterium]|nr:dephospho-CoA kinase [Cyclobacteriaceae bacterium]